MGVSFADLLHLGLAIHLVLLLNLPSTTSRPQPATAEVQPGKLLGILTKKKVFFSFFRFAARARGVGVGRVEGGVCHELHVPY